ncbi:MAG: alpha/beta hydrolase [Planctomycetes bacterium]|nr:alpha/beta hydrolase [Planctomycetota bacterium]
MTAAIDRVLYKQTEQGDLHIDVFRPPQAASCAIVFFVCGGWHGFDTTQFYALSTYLSGRGVLSAIAEVRSVEHHGTRPHECVIDAKSALRYVRAQATAWQFPVDRLVAAGGSAAGHVSLASAMIKSFDDTSDIHYPEVSSVPNLVCVYNPAVLPPLSVSRSTDERMNSRLEKFGGEDEMMKLSPYMAVSSDLPPMLIMHGDKDIVTPLIDSENFHKKMQAAGNDCTLIIYADAGHGFFNYAPAGNHYFDETTQHLDDFLVAQGFISGPSTFSNFVYDDSEA